MKNSMQDIMLSRNQQLQVMYLKITTMMELLIVVMMERQMNLHRKLRMPLVTNKWLLQQQHTTMITVSGNSIL